MSHSARLSDYRAALTTPGMRGPVVASLLARLPIAMVGLSLLLYVQRETGSFAVRRPGLGRRRWSASRSARSCRARLMDRLGPTRPLLVTAALFALLVTVADAGHRGARGRGRAGRAGVRRRPDRADGRLARPGRCGRGCCPPGSTRMAAYAYEAISMEVFFILGPGLAGLLIAAAVGGHRCRGRRRR